MQISLRSCVIFSVLVAIGSVAIRDRINAMPLPSEIYSKAKLDALLADDHPVLVSIFGRWTMSTMYSDALIKSSETVKLACRKTDARLLRADWTVKSPEVDALMAELGLNSAPATVVYCSDRSDPIVFPGLVSEAIVVNALQSCSNHNDKAKP